jgi:HEAT repeat protein
MAPLAVGTRPVDAAEVLSALGKVNDPAALPLLTLYAGNINLPVRLAAVKALGSFGDAKVVDTLLERLGDEAPPVRVAAAEALAERKERRAEKRLFDLLSRNDAAAAGPLGTIMDVASVPRLAELHGRIDDANLATALGEFLKRADVPDRLRLDVVRTVGRLPGAEATTALVEYLATVPDGERRPSRDEADKMLQERSARQ